MAERITGYAAKFNSETIIAGEFREMLVPGVFARSLRQNQDVLMLIGHDVGRVLGRTTAGTLELREDSVGLWFSLLPDPTTPSGQEALGNVRRGDVRGCSFGFRVRAEEWREGGSRLPLRIIRDADLFEVTLTAAPAYGDTTASLRIDGETSERQAAALARAQEAMRRRGIAA